MSYFYHWTTCTAWVSIQKQGLKLSKPTKRTSPVGVPYDVQGGKIWLCDREHIKRFAEHLKRIKGEKAAQVLRDNPLTMGVLNMPEQPKPPQMTEEQKKHFGEARIAAERAMKWADKADEQGLNVLAGFWREVHNILTIGIGLQQRAFRDSTLLTQTSKTFLEKSTGRLFDNEPPTDKTKS